MGLIARLKAWWRHRRRGLKIAIYRDGKRYWLDWDDLDWTYSRGSDDSYARVGVREVPKGLPHFEGKERLELYLKGRLTASYVITSYTVVTGESGFTVEGWAQ